MTHMWKCKETFVFDMPPQRIMDVYGKNVRFNLKRYLMAENPKVTNVMWEPDGPGLLVEVIVPKYPDERPYFTNDDQNQLLTSYMNYANMDWDEIREWYSEHSKVVVGDS